nr:hypothetical protein [Variovorax sp. JS1663]
MAVARQQRVGGGRGDPVVPAGVGELDLPAEAEEDFAGFPAPAVAGQQVLDHVLAGAGLQGPGDAAVGVVQDCGLDVDSAGGLDGRGVVVQARGGPGGAAVGIQAAADGEVAVAEDQRSLAVVDGTRADVQAMARGDGGGGSNPIDRLGQVVQGAGADGDRIAIDAAGADVGEGRCIDAGGHAVDDAAVGDGAARVQGGGPALDVAAGGVVDVGCRE